MSLFFAALLFSNSNFSRPKYMNQVDIDTFSDHLIKVTNISFQLAPYICHLCILTWTTLIYFENLHMGQDFYLTSEHFKRQI